MRFRNRVQHYINLEVISSSLLLLSLFLALCVSNSSLYDEYRSLIKVPIGFSVGGISINKPLIKWVNDGLMALFFLLLTIEAKFHCLEGEFNSKSSFTLPLIGALGGAIVPPLVYYCFTFDNPEYLKGWAIPIAMDTAFVLGILSFFANRITLSARLYIVALSIVDDLIAIFVLAIFYTSSLHFISLLIVFVSLTLLVILHQLRVGSLFLYMIVGLILWFALMESGIHGTIAGVILGLFIPLRLKEGGNRSYSPLKKLEHILHPIVAFAVLPIFAFLNGEIPFNELSLSTLSSPITLGTMAGLFLGKQIGIMAFSYIAIRLNLCKLPNSISWRYFYGLNVLCGIGFTFSIFIGLLSFEDDFLINQMKVGVILGSLFSALLGIIIFKGGKPLYYNNHEA